MNVAESRVFIVEKLQGINSDPAKIYGEVVPLFGKDKRISCKNTNKALRDVRDALVENKYDPSNDYIALSGQSVKLCMLFACCIVIWDRVSVLIWDAHKGKYILHEASKSTLAI